MDMKKNNTAATIYFWQGVLCHNSDNKNKKVVMEWNATEVLFGNDNDDDYYANPMILA